MDSVLRNSPEFYQLCVDYKKDLIERQTAICKANSESNDCWPDSVMKVCSKWTYTGGNASINMSDDNSYWYGENFQIYPEIQVEQFIKVYLPPIILTVGTIGNLFSSLIMHKLTHSVLSTCLYLTVLPILEIIWLFVRCGDTWLNKINDAQLSNRVLMMSDAMCKIYPFTFNFTVHFVHWLIVATCVEGFIVVRYPLKSRILCTFERARAVILLLTVLLICINAQYFWTYELVTMDGRDEKPTGTLCTFSAKGASQAFQESIWPAIDTMTSEILPIITVSVFVVLMIIHHLRYCKKENRDEEKMFRYMLDPDAFCELKILYMAIGILYVVLITPLLGHRIFDYICEQKQAYASAFKLDAQSILAEAVTETLVFIFLSCKFFLYLVLCKRFRKEFTKFVCDCCFRRTGKDIVGLIDETLERPLMMDKTCLQLDSPMKRWSSHWKVTEV